jgi:hypothetical protein
MQPLLATFSQAAAILRIRKISCIGALAIAALASAAPASLASPPELLHVTILQRGHDLAFQVLASPRVSLASLDRIPTEAPLALPLPRAASCRPRGRSPTLPRR